MNRKVMVALCSLLLVASYVLLLGRISAQTSATPSRITEAIDETRLKILRGNTHPFARPEFDQGTAPPDLPEERMLLVLKASPEQEAAALKFHAELQDKSSPNYHKWISPEEFGQRFGASDADIHTITSWLESYGLTVIDVAKARNLIQFSGTAGQVSAAFHTDIHSYVVNGEQHWANASDPALPSALVPTVTGVASLHNFPRRPASHFVGNFRRDKSTGQVQRLKKDFTMGTCNDLQSPPDCFIVGPGDFAAIYNLNPLYQNVPTPIDGTGVAIAIVSQSNINQADFHNFRSLFGLSAERLNIIINGTDPGIADPGDEGESDLDTQWSSAVARDAWIDLVVSKSTNASSGVDLSAAYIVQNAANPAIFPIKPSILSESYGACELQLGQAGNAMFGNPATGLWSEAAAEGITVVVSASDQGSAGCANPNPNITTEQPDTVGLNVSGLASTNFNIAVGGTDFNQMTNATNFWNTTNTTDALGVTQVSAKGYIPETTWNDSCANAIWGMAGFSANPETNCNDTTVSPSFIVPAGGGGGVSNCTNPSGNTASTCAGGNAKPPWQNGVTPADGHRDVPDVSLFAGAGLLGSFYVVCQQSQNPGQVPCSLNNVNDFQGFGGTSASTQTFAGMMALVVQAHGAQGLANPKLYTIAGGAGATCPSAPNPNLNSCIFFDTTVGNNEAPCVLAQAADCSATTPAAVPVATFKSFKLSNWLLLSFLVLCVSILPFAIHARRRNWAKAFGICAPAIALVFVTCGGGGGGGGGGNAPAVTLSSNSLSFGSQPVGTSSAAQSVTLTNGGTVTLTVSSVTTSGDYAQTNTCGASVVAGGNCTIKVTFTPTTTGARPGTLSITDNAAGSPQNVSLSGTGTAPGVTLSTDSLNFGSQVVGTTSAAQSVTLTNSGTVTLTVSSITTSGDYAQTNTCGASVAAGGNCTIKVTFTPTTTGARPGTLSISDNAAGSPQSVSLSGTGTQAQANGILNGYDAKPGYDLATGLGSVNATNLVKSSAW